MKYFSGFCLENESCLFDSWSQKGDFTVAGFSYGAIKALEYALNCSNRIDKIQLFSPAFFNDKDEKYKRLQLMFFVKDEKSYVNNFLENVKYPSQIDLNLYLSIGKKEELQELLYYHWDSTKLEHLISQGIKIEVYLGEEDKIINSSLARDFFKSCQCEVYFIKNVGHLLR